jgi:AcrR family transcriptional regulator
MPASTENTPRQDRILDAAARLIAHYGADKTTVSDIAREAGVGKGVLYLHWPSKEALLDALLVREMRRMLDDFMAGVEADPQGGSLPQMYRQALMTLRANLLMRALYTRDSRVLGQAMQRQGTARYTQRFLFGQALVASLQAAGLVRADLDPAALAYVLSLIAYGFTSIESIIPAAEAPPLAAVADALAGLMDHGVAQPGGDSQAGKQALRRAVELIERQYEAGS